MARIIILPEKLVNQIAAGEVVSRPASVVKELVENSLDAGATRIVVEVAKGGKDFIRVADNGSGLSRDEAKLAFQRHATSKIREEADLYSIGTFGFRGEALAAIASVAKVQVRTRLVEEEGGSYLYLEGGEIKEERAEGCPPGTSVMVEKLFFNTPARRKYLKSDFTELKHISDLVDHFILARPEVAFSFVSNGLELVSSTGSGSLEEAVRAVHDQAFTQNMIPIRREIEGLAVRGFLGQPSTGRPDRSLVSFFVNGRWVFQPLLARTLEEAGRGIVAHGRSPLAVVFIDIAPKLVDVNVHPTKKEVRFVRTDEVLGLIRQAVEGAYGKGQGREAVWEPTYSESKESFPQAMARNFFESVAGAGPAAAGEASAELFAQTALGGAAVDSLLAAGISWKNLPQPMFFQLADTYLVAASKDSLLLYDQHALHERILFDRLTDKKEAVSSQPLLFPLTLDIKPLEKELLNNNDAALQAFGFFIEDFGPGTVLVRQVPALAIKGDIKQMIDEILTDLAEYGQSGKIEEIRRAIAARVACHSAIRAGDKLSPAEIEEILKLAAAHGGPPTCPHGRPTAWKIPLAEVAKHFQRPA